MREIVFADGTKLPALGQGTWRMGEERSRHEDEVRALQAGLDLGLTLIDTAEMYGEGAAEEVVGEAIRGRRDDAFIVSKVYPHNAGARSCIAACERSLKRLRVDALDLYLLHWRGAVPLAETVAAFERLVADGKIRRWGVSNLDMEEMEELTALPGGDACATDQVLYNPLRRGIERDLLPWCRARGMPVMAYSPIEQGRLPEGALDRIGEAHGVGRHVVALAWVMREPGVVAIPKSGDPARVKANRAALDLVLSPDDLDAIDRAMPRPKRRVALEML